MLGSQLVECCEGLGVWPCWRRCVPRVAFKILKVLARPSLPLSVCLSVFPLPVDHDLKLSATFLAPCLSVWHASSWDGNGLTLWNGKQAPSKFVFFLSFSFLLSFFLSFFYKERRQRERARGRETLGETNLSCRGISLCSVEEAGRCSGSGSGSVGRHQGTYW